MKRLMKGLSDRVRTQGAWSTVCDAATRGWRRAFRHRQLVFEMPAAAASALVPPGSASRILVFREPEQLPEALRSELSSRHGQPFAAYVDANLRSGAQLYLLNVEERIASILWAKPGDRVSAWYVPVGAEDVILYGWWTDPGMRGRGLIRQLISAATRDALPHAKRFLADVRVWNTPSIHAMERVGFRRIAEARPR